MERSPAATSPPLRALRVATVAAAVWHIGFFFIIAMRRSRFPLQLEWLEGGVLAAVQRVLMHQPVYAAPTHVFVPYIYTPLYYYVAALFNHVAGEGFAPLRWLSTLCTLGCFACIATQTRALAGRLYPALVATGLFAALYRATAGWYDLARVDMLFLVLMLAATLASWRSRPWLAGLLFACAFQTKQSAAIIAICVLLHELRRPRQAIIGMLVFVSVVVTSAMVLQHATHGWYSFYTETLPRHHALYLHGVLDLFGRDLLLYAGPALLLIALALRGWRPQPWSSRRDAFLIAVTFGTFLAAFTARIHSGGAPNVTLPLYAWLAVLFGLALARCLRTSPLPALPAALAAVQLALLVASPALYLPSPAAWQQSEQLIRALSAQPGNLYVVDDAVELEPAHKQSFANGDAVYDVLRAGDSAAARQLQSDLAASFTNRQYSAIISPQPLAADHLFAGAPADLGRYYNLAAAQPLPGSDAQASRKPLPPHAGRLLLIPALPR